MTQSSPGAAAGDGYAAKGYPPELKGQVVNGRLHVSPEVVRFEYDGKIILLPLAGLILRVGGHNDEQLFFEHPQLAGWSIICSDPALVHNTVLSSRPEFTIQLWRVLKARTGIPKPVILGVGLLALFFGLLLLLILQKDRIVRVIVERIPLSWEEKLGDQVFQQVTAGGELVEESDWDPAVAEITGRLLPIVEQSGYNFRFHILQDTNVNAFAIPGGHVVILTGLLEAAGSAEEVAGVVAHEIAHVTERHSLRQIVQSAGLWVIVTALFGDTTGVAAVLTEGSQFLIRQGFSRDFERDADDKGWNYLVAAEIDPRGMTRFFERLKAMYEETGAGAMEGSLALLNTHPATDERIERLEQKWADVENKAQFVPFEDWPKREAPQDE